MKRSHVVAWVAYPVRRGGFWRWRVRAWAREVTGPGRVRTVIASGLVHQRRHIGIALDLAEASATRPEDLEAVMRADPRIRVQNMTNHREDRS